MGADNATALQKMASSIKGDVADRAVSLGGESNEHNQNQSQG